MTYSDRHLKFESPIDRPGGLRKILTLSLGAHLFIFILIPIIASLRSEPRVMPKAYLFDMVETKPHVHRSAVATPKASLVEPKKMAVPIKHEKKLEKAISTKKELVKK